jgi:hypothetical protein
MTKSEIAELIDQMPQDMDVNDFIHELVNRALAVERKEVLITINELMGMESDRNPIFSEGHNYALSHIEEFVQGREKKWNSLRKK